MGSGFSSAITSYDQKKKECPSPQWTKQQAKCPSDHTHSFILNSLEELGNNHIIQSYIVYFLTLIWKIHSAREAGIHVQARYIMCTKPSQICCLEEEKYNASWKLVILGLTQAQPVCKAMYNSMHLHRWLCTYCLIPRPHFFKPDSLFSVNCTLYWKESVWVFFFQLGWLPFKWQLAQGHCFTLSF